MRAPSRAGDRAGDPPAAAPSPPWHAMPADAVLAALASSPRGLDAAEARRRLAAHGPNALPPARRRGPLRMFADQFADFMILVLVGAALVSGLVGEVEDTIAIVTILTLNAVIGFVQEFRAERAMEALAAMAAPSATVERDGGTTVIDATDLVPGDIVRLEAGTIVPADLRLLENVRLRTDEAALTGESVPVDKTTGPLAAGDLAPGHRTNVAFKGTVVTYGRGRGVVVATGSATEFGRIAALLQETREAKTPLQRRLGQFGARLALAAIAICAIVFVAGLTRGEPALLMFMTAVSLAVAAIPEALPAVVTISLALGAHKMARKKALVRRLPAVETLGSVTYVCADKTGTLTLNRMRVEAWYCDGTFASAPGAGGCWDHLARAMALCNDAHADGSAQMVGDPTEVALALAAAAAGCERAEAERRQPRLAELPFDSERMCMTTVHPAPDGGAISFTKGALEALQQRAATIETATGAVPVDREALARASERMAADGLRVLALAMRRWPAPPAPVTSDVVEGHLSLLGLVGLADPPRPEAGRAVETCRRAGIVPVMITGDHPATARAIGRRLGMLDDGDDTVTGRELAHLAGEALAERVRHARVYARVAPAQKLTIVTALQARGEIVAMTGDGVNDAPALRQADIGIAMGVTGTDVAKEASAMILLDDDFATIVRAVEEGRRIYDNMRRFIKYAVSTNSAEIWTIFLAPFLGLPIPLLPVQILWVNLVTDGLPGLALAAEPAERDVMRRPPRPPRESVFARGLGVHVVWAGILMAALTLGTQVWFVHGGAAQWQTMTFTVLCFAQLAHVLAIRSERDSLFVQGLRSNPALLGAVLLTVGLQMAAIYAPPLRRVFRTVPLSPAELAVAFAVASVVFFAVELEKWLRRRRAASE